MVLLMRSGLMSFQSFAVGFGNHTIGNIKFPRFERLRRDDLNYKAQTSTEGRRGKSRSG